MTSKKTRRRVFKSTLWKSQSGICFYCDRRMNWNSKSKRFATFDHVIPKSKGGQWADDNLVLCCYSCNQRKANQEVTMSGVSCSNGAPRKGEEQVLSS